MPGQPRREHGLARAGRSGRRRWCPPAAATSSASIASALPTTSARSPIRPRSTVGVGVSASTGSTVAPRRRTARRAAPPRRAARPPRRPRCRARAGLGGVRRRHHDGVEPARAAASTAGRMPCDRPSRPSSPSSPRCTTRSTEIGSTVPAPRGTPSRWPGRTRSLLGQRGGRQVDGQVARGSGQPALSRLSGPFARLAERGIGQPDDDERRAGAERSASTSTTEPASPTRAIERVRATGIRRSPRGARRSRAPSRARAPRSRRCGCDRRARRVRRTTRREAAQPRELARRDRLERVPEAIAARVFTSTKTASSPSRATRSSSPCRQRQLRSMTRMPRASRWSAASCSPRRPSSACQRHSASPSRRIRLGRPPATMEARRGAPTGRARAVCLV